MLRNIHDENAERKYIQRLTEIGTELDTLKRAMVKKFGPEAFADFISLEEIKRKISIIEHKLHNFEEDTSRYNIQISGLQRTKTTLAEIQANNNTWTGQNNFLQPPEYNGVPLLTSNNNIYTVTLTSNYLLILQNFQAYILKNASGNIILDFSNITFNNSTTYTYKFTTYGIYYAISCINMKNGTHEVLNIYTGIGTDLVKQTVNIDIDNIGNIVVTSESYNFNLANPQPQPEIDVNSGIAITNVGDSAIEIMGSNPTSNLFYFDNYGPSTGNSLDQTLCTGDGKTILSDSTQLLIKCNVTSLVDGVNINGNYYIPMYQVTNT